MKTCFKCLQSLPLEAFYKHSAMGDGHLGKCKECTKKDAKAHRLAKIDQIRAYDRLRSSQPHRKALAKVVHARWKREHPERRAANVAVGNAIRDGHLKKQLCWVCGGKGEAHHPDYSRPLDVVWLCRIHHAEAHALVANEQDMERAA